MRIATQGLVVAVLAGSALVAGCSDTAREAPARRAPEAARAAAPAAEPEPEPTLYDAEGRLLPSEERFHGFPIPVGFRRTASVAGLFVYESTRVPLAKLRGYVAPRVTTGEIEELGATGWVFRNATVQGAGATDHRFDVFVTSVRGGVQLRLQDLPPPEIAPGTTPAERERQVREALSQQQRD